MGKILPLLTGLFLVSGAAAVVAAQGQPRVQFPPTGTTATPTALQPGVGTTPTYPAPPPGAVPPNGLPTAPPSYGFDPYSSTPGTAAPPSLLGTPGATTAPNTTWTSPGMTSPGWTSPGTLSPPPTYPAAPGDPLTVPPYGGGAVPGAPPSLFPNGVPTWNAGTAYGAPPMRLVYGPRARYTWVYPDSGDRQFGSNDFDVSASLAIPNFLWSGQPIFITPSFGLHLWDGPKPPVTFDDPGLSPDLPSKAYDAYLDFGWGTDPTKIVSAEVGFRAGVFSDFNALTTYSARYQGLGLLHLQVTPTTRLKGGVMYLDRVKVKMLPAFGVLWEPNPQTRLDIYFPQPKLARYLTTMGTYDVWWYVGGEYGGGSWTIEHVNGANDRIDINDIRLYLGFEWGQQSLMKKGRRIGFIEGGWVTEREIVFWSATPDVTLSDTFMLRAGIGY